MKWVATPMASARSARERVARAAAVSTSRKSPVCANRCVPERIPAAAPSFPVIQAGM